MQSFAAVQSFGTVTTAAPLQSIIPSYLYQQYADDADLQAFVTAYNTIAQQYLNWFNQTPLAVYSNINVSGQLLNWIAAGIYGVQRPVFTSGIRKYIAGLNAVATNTLPLNGSKIFTNQTAVVATDDFFRRVLTWYFYVGNGRRFTVPMLRLRVARFLYGVDGTDITLAQAQTVHIQPNLLAPPPPPQISTITISNPSQGLNSAALNARALNAGQLQPRGTRGVYAGLNVSALNTLPTNGSRLRKSLRVQAQITFVTPMGESLPSGLSSLYMMKNQLLVVQSPPAPSQNYQPHYLAGINANALNLVAINRYRFRKNGAVNENGVIGWNVYAGPVGTAIRRYHAGLNAAPLDTRGVRRGILTVTYPGGSRQNPFPIPIGTNWTEPRNGFVRGASLPIKNTSNTVGNLIITVPPSTAATYFQEAMNQGVLPLPFQLSASVVT